MPGLAATPAVYHYAPDRHALEQRCAFPPSLSPSLPDSVWLVALTSIHWREAWKYGERAFRYCQHDLGHAIAALRISADLAGLRAQILPDWSHAEQPQGLCYTFTLSLDVVEAPKHQGHRLRVASVFFVVTFQEA